MSQRLDASGRVLRQTPEPALVGLTSETSEMSPLSVPVQMFVLVCPDRDHRRTSVESEVWRGCFTARTNEVAGQQ